MSDKICLFVYGGRSFCLPASRVLQVLQRPRIFILPLMRKEMDGVFFYRDDLVPFLRPEKVFPFPGEFRQEVCFVLVCCSDQGLFGLPCDRVVKIIDSTAGVFASAMSEDCPGGDTIFSVSHERYSYLDVERLLPHRPSIGLDHGGRQGG